MSDQNPQPSFDSQESLSKWAVIAVIAVIAILSLAPALHVKAKPVAGIEPVSQAVPQGGEAPAEPKSEEPKAEAPKSKPSPRVVASAPAATPRGPTGTDVAACNQAAAAARTQPGEMVRDGVVGAAVGAGVGAASGAIADGKKGAGKGAGIGAVVGAAAGTVYTVNKRSQDDARAESAYRTCMAQRGF